MVDTAVAGHLPVSGGTGAATFIGAISVGAMIFNLLYWNCAFLRTGTGGLTAQAFGREDNHECAVILVRGIRLAFIMSAAILVLQWPFMKLALLIVNGSPEVEALASEYYLARIWAAPATLSLMSFSGWFVGMQDSVSSMWKDLTVNCVNILASIVLALEAGPFKGMGFVGIAWGTVIAQYSGLLYCIIKCLIKYKPVLAAFRKSDLKSMFSRDNTREFFKMNVDLLIRSLCFTAIYIGYTIIAAGLGDLMLACSSIMMQLLMIFSYFTDGFAYAGEALTGRFIGAGDEGMLKKAIRHVFVWSMSIAVLFVWIYWICGVPLLQFMTSDGSVVTACKAFLPWLIAMPPLGCAAFTWDGIYLGATATKAIRNSMLGAAASFLLIYLAGVALFHPEGQDGIQLLMVAYFAHLAFRTVYLTLQFRKNQFSGCGI